MLVVLLTGISGSGKSVAIRALEDDGFFCIDNLPATFLREVIDSLERQGYDRVAVAIDARTGSSLQSARAVLPAITQAGHDLKVVFLDANTATLVQRYAETRRRHPLAGASTGVSADSLLESIERERELMAPMSEIALVIDTTDLHPNVLRQWIRDALRSRRASITLMFESFAYRHGVPLDANLVFDARCLPNPFYVAGLRELTGLDEPVRQYLKALPEVGRMLDDIEGFLRKWLPLYDAENRSYLTVAVGCTGGQHRSVYLVEELALRLRARPELDLDPPALVRHRGLAHRKP